MKKSFGIYRGASSKVDQKPGQRHEDGFEEGEKYEFNSGHGFGFGNDNHAVIRSEHGKILEYLLRLALVSEGCVVH